MKKLEFKRFLIGVMVMFVIAVFVVAIFHNTPMANWIGGLLGGMLFQDIINGRL